MYKYHFGGFDMAEKKDGYRWVILVVACIVMFGPNYTQYQLSPLAPQLIDSFKLTPSQFAGIFSSPMIPALIFSLIAGLLVDKFGIKLIVGIALCIATAGTFWRIWANSYQIMFISMMLGGFSATFLNANGAKLMGSWFLPEEISGKTGIFLASQTIAMTLAMATTALLPSIKIAFTIAFIITGISLVLWVILIKKPKKNIALIQEAPASPPVLTCLKIVIRNRSLWVVGFCLFFILGSNVVVGSFLPAALGQRGINTTEAGIYSSLITIGLLAGALISPVFASKIGKNKPVLLIFSLIAAFFIAFGWQAPAGVLLAIALFIAGVSMGGMMPLLVSMPIQLPEIGPAYAGTAGGFVSTLQLLGAVLLPAYVITPIAGDNMNLLFILGGVCLCLIFFLVFALPELGQGRKKGA
jgi:NNP family nitrate/nitrite transporter-like MFS transporter